jgi:hypothetical protein
MRNALFIALTATLAGVLLDRYLRKRDAMSETAPAARQSPGVASILATGSGDKVQGADYWSQLGGVKIVGASASLADVSSNAFSGYAYLGRSPVVETVH